MKLNTTKRTTLGKRVKTIRKMGMVPAELFGFGFKNEHLSVPEKAFSDIYKEAGRNTVIDITIDGEKEAIPALIHDVQIHPITHQPLAVDFYRIRADKKIQTEVPIEFIGESPAENKGLVVVKVLNKITIEALPQHIPHTIQVDISVIKNEEDTLHIKDLNLPNTVYIITPADTTIITVSQQQQEEEVSEVSSVEEVEITKEKKGEEPTEETGEEA